MDKVCLIDELLLGIAAIKDLKKGLISNFYLDPIKHQIWIEQGDCFVTTLGNTFFVIKKNAAFWNVFYNSTDVCSLQTDLDTLQKCNAGIRIVLDLVGKEKQIAEIRECFQNLGFFCIRRLVRMSKPFNKLDVCDDKLEYADETDAEEILVLLNKYFDVFTEQIPYLQEIKILIQEKQALIYRVDGKIIAFVLFEKNKSTLYLRYWFVLPEYRGQKIGASLLRRMFKEGIDCKRQILWVVDDNVNAIQKYHHYGFKEEGLIDVIYSNIF